MLQLLFALRNLHRLCTSVDVSGPLSLYSTCIPDVMYCVHGQLVMSGDFIMCAVTPFISLSVLCVGRVVAVDWVVPKDLYETAKDTSTLYKEEDDKEEEEAGEVGEEDKEEEEEESESRQLKDSANNEDSGSGPDSCSDDIDDESDMETTDRKENDNSDSRNEVEGNGSDEDDVTSLESISDDDQEMEEEEGEENGTEDESDSEDELPVSLATTSPKSKDKKQAHQSNDVKEGKTVFIR